MKAESGISIFWDGKVGSGTAERAITTSSLVPCISNSAAEMPLQPNWKPRLWKCCSSTNFMPYFALLRLLVQQGPGRAKSSGQLFCLCTDKTCQCMHYNSDYSAVIMCETPLTFRNQALNQLQNPPFCHLHGQPESWRKWTPWSYISLSAYMQYLSGAEDFSSNQPTPFPGWRMRTNNPHNRLITAMWWEGCFLPNRIRHSFFTKLKGTTKTVAVWEKYSRKAGDTLHLVMSSFPLYLPHPLPTIEHWKIYTHISKDRSLICQ